MVSWALVVVVTFFGAVVVATVDAAVVGKVFVVVTTLAMDFVVVVVVVCARAVVVTAFAGASQGTVELTTFSGIGTIEVGNALVPVASAAGAAVVDANTSVVDAFKETGRVGVVVATGTAVVGGKSSCNLIVTG